MPIGEDEQARRALLILAGAECVCYVGEPRDHSCANDNTDYVSIRVVCGCCMRCTRFIRDYGHLLEKVEGHL